MSELIPWYDGRSILITGGTGFLGKVLLEKLLRCVPGIHNIYIVCRPKRGVTPTNRLAEIFKTPLFNKCVLSHLDRLQKIVVLEGDISAPFLGLSEQDRIRVQQNVSVVFHVAATLKLEARLKDSLMQNTVGTTNVLELCKTMKNLVALVHLSTAFCHPDLEVLDEKVYEPTRNPKDVINFMQWIDEDSLDQITPSILGQHPNTYTFTKRLAEALVNEAGKEIPVIILRPSIVIPSYKEPIEGWVDSLNGPIGVIVAAGKGVIRSMLTDPKHHAEIVPVDIAVNTIIFSAYIRAKNSFSETPVFNVSQSDVVSITWGEVLGIGRDLINEYPFEWPLWYPDGNIRTNKLVHYSIVFFFQWIPALFLDFIFLITFQKRFMVRIQNRISLGMKLLQYFTMREWKFKNSKFVESARSLNKTDREMFFTDNIDIDIKNYLKNTILGARQYCMKENLKTLPMSRMYMKFLYVLDKIAKLAFFGFIFWMILNVNKSFNEYQNKYYQAI